MANTEEKNSKEIITELFADCSNVKKKIIPISTRVMDQGFNVNGILLEEDKKHHWSTHENHEQQGLWFYLCGHLMTYTDSSELKRDYWAERHHCKTFDAEGKRDAMRKSLELEFPAALVEVGVLYPAYDLSPYNRRVPSEREKIIHYLKSGISKGIKSCALDLAELLGYEGEKNLKVYVDLIQKSWSGPVILDYKSNCDSREVKEIKVTGIPYNKWELIAKAYWANGKDKEGCIAFSKGLLLVGDYGWPYDLKKSMHVYNEKIIKLLS